MEKQIIELTDKELKQVRKWIKALRSGKYSQATSALQTSKGYCCLGVACKVLIPENRIRKKPDSNEMAGWVINNQPFAPMWLSKFDYAVMSIQGDALVIMNDKLGYSFSEIADLIEFIIDNRLYEMTYNQLTKEVKVKYEQQH